VIKLSRYNSFTELKSANNLTERPDMNLLREYEAFIALLRSSAVTQKAISIKPGKNKKENG